MPSVTFITHDGSRTGAPAVLLTLMRWLRTHTDLNMATLAVRPGPLLDEFALLGPVRLLDEWPHFRRVSLLLRSMVTLTSVPRAKSSSRILGRAGERILNDARRTFLRGLRDCDLIYANSLLSSLGVEAIRDHQPLISHLHEGADYLLAKTFRERVQTVVHRADQVIASSAAVRDVLVTRVGVPNTSVTVCYPFIDSNAFKSAGDKRVLRSTLGIPEDAFVVGMCGDASWRKGPDVFAAVARETLKRAPEKSIFFLWVGGGVGASAVALRYMRRDIDRLGLKNQMRFVRHQADPLPYMGAFDVFFLSSRADVYPIVCLEAALVAGMPIVCFDGAGAMTELAGEGGGIAVPYLDVAEAASAILTLMRDDDMRTRMGHRLAELVLSRHDVAMSAPRIHALINEFAR